MFLWRAGKTREQRQLDFPTHLDGKVSAINIMSLSRSRSGGSCTTSTLVGRAGQREKYLH